MENNMADRIWNKIMDKFETLEDGQMLEIDLNVSDEEREAFEKEAEKERNNG